VGVSVFFSIFLLRLLPTTRSRAPAAKRDEDACCHSHHNTAHSQIFIYTQQASWHKITGRTCILRGKEGGHGGMCRCCIAANGIDQLGIEVCMEGQLVENHVLQQSNSSALSTPSSTEEYMHLNCLDQRKLGYHTTKQDQEQEQRTELTRMPRRRWRW
jgi:hypothetical protein